MNKKLVFIMFTTLLLMFSVISVQADAENEVVIIPEITIDNSSCTGILQQLESSEDDVYASSVNTVLEEAAVELRRKLVAREESITITMHFESEDEIPDNCTDALLERALAETGEAAEGAYLEYNIFSITQGGNYYTDGTAEASYSFVYYTTAAQEQEMVRLISDIITDLNLADLSDYRKVKRIYEYILDHLEYDDEHASGEAYLPAHSAYTAVTTGNVVCQGYALLFYRLLKAACIDARIITGQAGGGNHMWNNVCLDGEYYECDVTWEDTSSTTDSFFLKGKDNFPDHWRDERCSYSIYPVSENDYKIKEEDLPHTEEVVVNNVIYEVSDDSAAVVGYVGMPEVVILENTVNGAPVKRIAATAFSECESLREITLSSNIQIIEDDIVVPIYDREVLQGWDYKRAFGGCHNLTTVNFPADSRLSYIGQNAFFDDPSIETLVFPASIRTLAIGSFAQCSNLESVILPEGLKTVGQNAFDHTAIKTLHIPSTCTYFERVQPLLELENITVAGGNPVYKVVDGALYSKSDAGDILYMYPPRKKDKVYTIPDTCSMVDGLAFPIGDQNGWWQCPFLEELNVGDSDISGFWYLLCKINTSNDNPYYRSVDGVLYSVDYKTLLKVPVVLTGEFVVPKGVETIAAYATAGSVIDSIVIPETVTSIEEAAFMNSQIRRVNLSEGMTELAPALFASAPVEEIVLPSTLRKIGSGAFQSCCELEEIEVPAGVLEIEDRAFASMHNLRKVNLPVGITYIGAELFMFSYHVNDIVIPDTVTEIREQSFYGTSIGSITIPASVEHIEWGAFDACECLKQIIIENPDCVLDDYSYTIDSRVTIYGYPDSTAEAYAQKYNRSFVSLLDVTEPEYIWSDDYSLVTALLVDKQNDLNVVKTETVKTNMFVAQSPTENEMGKTTFTAVFTNSVFEEQSKTVTDIPSLNDMTALVLPSGLKKIEDEAFKGLACLAVIVPDGCTSIGEKAFADCEVLLYVKVPATVTSIAENAFNGSTKARIDIAQ